jgi:hypothetical protein
MGSRAESPLSQDVGVLELTNVRQAWPWPYTDNELNRIATCLPNGGEVALENVVLSARLHHAAVRHARRISPKENANFEIQRLARLIDEFLAALGSLGPEARKYLNDADPSHAFQQHCSGAEDAMELLRLNPGLRQPPEKRDRRGRPINQPLNRLLMWLENIFRNGSSGKLPRGFPAFRAACLEPLGLAVEEKSQQKRSARAKRGTAKKPT